MKNLILVLFLLVLISCEKDTTEPMPTPTPPPTEEKHELTYFVIGDSAVIQYNIMDKEFVQTVSKWDTTFTAPGGWYVDIFVSGSEMITGVILDGDTVDGCNLGTWCLMGVYVH